MSTYEKALEIATTVHNGQTRWDGTPYIKHPEAVANSFTTKDIYLKSYSVSDIPYLRIVSILHDGPEDHPDKVSFDSLLKAGFHVEIVNAIRLLTRNKKEPYLDYLKPMLYRENWLAREVKKADLTHNLSCFPLKLTSYEKNTKDKYELALFILETIRV